MRGILRASALMGGSSVVTILAGIARVKIVALLLGPSGVGLLGLYRSFITVSSTVTGLGLGTIGIKVIADASARGDEKTMSQTRTAIEICSALVALIGAVVLVVFREPVARIVFGDAVGGAAVGWTGLGIIASTVSVGQVAVLNGLRRLGDMALVSIAGAVVATLVALVAIWMFKETGVLIAAISLPVASLAASSYFVFRIGLPRVSISRRALFDLAVKLVRPGVVFMVTALVSLVVPLIIRVIITNELGLVETGYFEAAWGISMLYLGFILSAMGADYFPRLSEVSEDPARINLVFNEQIEAVLLLAAPVIAGMLTLAPVVVEILYSSKFTASVSILRWQLLGDIFKVIGWSMSIVLLAQNRQFEFFVVETLWAVSYVAILYLGLGVWGLDAAGIGFFVSYVIYAASLWLILFRTATVRLRKGPVMFAAILFLIGLTVSLVARVEYWGPVVGLICTAGLGVYSIKTIHNRVRTQDLQA